METRRMRRTWAAAIVAGGTALTALTGGVAEAAPGLQRKPSVQIYTVDRDNPGKLWANGHQGPENGGTAFDARKEAGHDWNVYPRILSGRGNRLYGIDANGDLWTYKVDPNNPAATGGRTKV